MSKLPADMNYTAFYYESGTYGTPSGALQPFGQVQNFDGGDDPGLVEYRTQGDDSRRVAGVVVGTKRFNPVVTQFPQDMKALLFMLGSGSESGAGPYTHNIVQADGNDGNPYTSGAEIPWISKTIYNVRQGAAAGDNHIRQYAGCILNDLAIDIPVGEIVSVEETYTAQSMTSSSGAAVAKPTLLTTRPFIASDVVFHAPSGTVMDKNTNINIRFSNNLDGEPVNDGTNNIDTPTPGEFEAEITLDGPGYSEWANYFYNLASGAGTFNGLVYVTRSGAETGAISLSGCYVPGTNAGAGLTGVNEDSFTLRAKGPFSATIVDDIAKYGAW